MISPVLAPVVVRHVNVVVLLLQQLLIRGDMQALVQLHAISSVLSASVVRHMALVVLLLQPLFLIGNAHAVV